MTEFTIYGGSDDNVGPLLDRALDAITFERERADKAEAELDALADRLGTVIRAATEAEAARAETAEAEAARLRELLTRQGRGGEAREFLPPAEAARRLGVHVRTLTRLEGEGMVEAERKPNGQRRYRAVSVEALRRRREGGRS